MTGILAWRGLEHEFEGRKVGVVKSGRQDATHHGHAHTDVQCARSASTATFSTRDDAAVNSARSQRRIETFMSKPNPISIVTTLEPP